ncbi:MAG: CBS domain-containing protein [Gammaproteobacteria bacterium]|nr:CBS domain-containing protein [Gammaproteobacteria bacterium]
MKVEEIMNHKVEAIAPNDTIKEAARKMHDLHIGALTVMDGDELVGILTDRDICCKVTAMGRDAVMTRVREIMTKDVITCYADQDIGEAADLMMSNHIRRLAVTSRGNSVTGFLSVDDIAHTSYDLASNILESSAPIH